MIWQTISTWFRSLYEATGINLTIFYDTFDRDRFVNGALLTIELSLLCIVASVAIGIIGAWLQGSRFRITNRLVRGYVSLFRNTPPVVQLFFFFFVLGAFLTFKRADGQVFQLSSFFWAAVSLSFYYGSFNIEIFRAGVEAVPDDTVHAAEALGYRQFQIYRYVVLPLAVRISLPALGNNFVSLVKATSLAYTIAVPEVTYVSTAIFNDDFNVTEMMVTLLIFYLALVGLMVIVMRRIERALKMPGYNIPGGAP